MVESIIYFKIKIELHAKLSEASRSTLSDLCLVLVPSGVSGIVSAGLPGLDDRDVPILLVDELELETVALDFTPSSWFCRLLLQLEVTHAWPGNSLSSLANFLASSLLALTFCLRVLSP